MSKIDNFPYPTPVAAKIWGCSVWSRTVMLGFAESEMARLISREIFSQIYNVYDHDTSTSQTDRRMDRQTDSLPWQYRATLKTTTRIDWFVLCCSVQPMLIILRYAVISNAVNLLLSSAFKVQDSSLVIFAAVTPFVLSICPSAIGHLMIFILTTSRVMLIPKYFVRLQIIGTVCIHSSPNKDLN